MECSLIGVPQSGKSTLFSLLTGIQRDQADFGKRETKRGVAKLADKRLDALAEFWKSQKVVNATVEYVDVPGIETSGETKEPYPAKYLAEIRGADMLALVIRDFDEPTTPHPLGSVDAMRDLMDTGLEFIVNDLDVIERRLQRIGKLHDADSKAEHALLEKCHSCLSEDKHLRDLELTTDERKRLRGFSFLSMKPILIILNLGEENAGNAGARLRELKESTDFFNSNAEWVSAAASIEAEIQQLDEEERIPFMEELGFTDSALDRIIDATFRLMNMMTFLTAGEKESRAWTIPRESTAVNAARQIHEDLARGFIRAEVYFWQDIIDAGSEAKLKKLGKMRLEGKDYIVQDGDVLNIRFNV